MNIKEYISGGMVESYVLGLASDEERMEFERLCAQYPELVEARNNFELLLEQRAMENAAVPPVEGKDKIWSVIQQSPASNTSKIVTMEPTTPSRPASFNRWVAAAAVILMLGAAYFAFDYNNKNKELQKANDELKAQNNAKDSLLEIINAPNVTVVNMAAMKPAAPSVNVYWDTTSTNVYLMIKNVPKLANDKQYQLWAIIDSNGLKPTSLGLFDGGKEKIILKMNNVQKADAFAITIEQKGNAGGPHLEELQTMGKTKL